MAMAAEGTTELGTIERKEHMPTLGFTYNVDD